MAILVYFKVDISNNLYNIPPTLVASDWFRKLTDYTETKMNMRPVIGDVNFTLDNMYELNNFVRDYKLTDATLLDDLAVWKAAHGITFTGGFYDLSPGGGLIQTIDNVLPIDIVAVDTSLIK